MSKIMKRSLFYIVLLLMVMTNPSIADVENRYGEIISYNGNPEESVEILSRISIMQKNLVFFSLFHVEDPFNDNYTLVDQNVLANENPEEKTYLGLMTFLIPLN